MATPASTPKAAVIGTGFIGPVHLEALRRIGVPVAGILGSTAAKSKRAAEELGLQHGYRDLNELLGDSDVSVVHIASPNRLHREQVLSCLQANRHVVCEKPLGMTTAEAEEMAAAAAKRPDLVCAVNYNIRFYPLMLQARAMVQAGGIGEIFHIQGSYTQDWLLHRSDFNWRVLPELGGKLRAVSDIGTHWLDLLTFITGLEVEAVFADLRTVYPTRLRSSSGSVETYSSNADPMAEEVPIATEDHGSVLLRFKGGARGNLVVSQVMAGRKNSLRFEIAGSKHALAWDSENAEQLWRGARDSSNEVILRDPSRLDPSAAKFASYPGGHAEGFPDTFKQLYRAIYEDIRAGRPSPQPLYATFADGLRELRLCDAIAESNRVGAWVQL